MKNITIDFYQSSANIQDQFDILQDTIRSNLYFYHDMFWVLSMINVTIAISCDKNIANSSSCRSKKWKKVFIVQVFANLQMKVNSRVWYLNLMSAVSNCEVNSGNCEGPWVQNTVWDVKECIQIKTRPNSTNWNISTA